MEPFRVSVPLRSLLAFRKGFILWTPLEDNFFRLLLFCTVRCSNFCRNWVSKVKKPLGLQNRGRFQKAIFRNVSAARANLARGGCAAVSFFSVDFGSLPKMSSRLRRVFPSFAVFYVRPRFRKPQVVLFTSPSFSLGVFLFWLHSSWDWGQCRIAVVFLGSWPSTLLIFWGLLRKALFFPLKKGYLGSFLSVSLLCLPFVLLGFFHFSLSLSLSLYLSFFLLYCFFFFLVVLFYFYLPCFIAVISCLVASFLFHEKNNINILHLKVLFS